MRLFAGCKRYLLAGWGMKLFIAFALFTLCLLTKSYVQSIGEPREMRRASVGDKGIMDSLDVSRAYIKGPPARDQGSGRYVDDGSSADDVLIDDSPPFVIIMGQWRFGSSVIGQLFNQNPDIFFLFEPLWVVDQLRKERRLPLSPFAKEVHEYSTDVLRRMSGCVFSDEFISVSNKWGGLVNNRLVCQQGTGCRFPNAQWLSNLCLRFDGYIATKVIRADLEIIRSLVVDDRINVKLIHLVRDPRGAAASRIHYYFKFWQKVVKPRMTEFAEKGRLEPIGLTDMTERPKDSIPTMCQWMRDNVQTPHNITDWLRNRYYLLRYEDFAESPVKVAEDLYRFVGRPLPDSVKTWIIQNTLTQHSHTGAFDTHKNSRETAKHWLSDLSELEINQVEAHCLDVMERLDYVPYAKLINNTQET